MFSTDFICEGFHSKIIGKGLPILHWWKYMGIFHIRRSHGVGNHDFLFLRKNDQYDKMIHNG